MALIKCPECGKEFSDKAPACIHCGCPTPEASKNMNNEAVQDECVKEEGEQYYKQISGDEENKKSVENNNNFNYVAEENQVEEKRIKEKFFKKKEKNSKKLFERKWFVILMLFLFFPVGLFFMWKNKVFNKPVRIVISAVFGLWVIYLFMPCFHEWEEATCTTPKTCSICLEEEGEPLGHKWEEATCESAKRCSVCDKTEGEKLEHTVEEWKVDEKATCTKKGSKSGKCTMCNTIISKTIKKEEHKAGDWKISKKATSTSNGKKVKKCTVCGKVLKTKDYELSAKEKKQAYKKECNTYSYEKIARNPDKYDGKKAKFKGEVIQVMEDGDDYTLRVNVTKGDYFWEDTILVTYTKNSSGEARILEDDIITLYGELGGTYTYESVMGASITIPILYAEYVEF